MKQTKEHSMSYDFDLEAGEDFADGYEPSMTVLEQYACQFWDMYKDAYGIRPRGIDTSAWTEEQFEAEFRQLGMIIADNDRERKEAEERAMHDFEMRVQGLLMSGAKDRTMALRWVHEAEGSNGDDDYLCYLIGLPYGYFRKVDGFPV
jgi:hypothetical protein